MRTIKAIEKDLKEHEELLGAAVEQDEKDFMKDAIKALKDELKKAEEAADKKPSAKKPATKKAPFKVGDVVKDSKSQATVKKVHKPKEGTPLFDSETHLLDIVREDGKKAINMAASRFTKVSAASTRKKAKKFIEVDGKKIYEDDPTYCSHIIADWERRKKAAKKSQTKRKTRSMMRQVASSAASTVVKGIKSISHEELEKNAEKEIKKMKRLESAAKEYLAAYKDIVGEKLTQAEIKEEFEGVDNIINKINSKYVKGDKK